MSPADRNRSLAHEVSRTASWNEILCLYRQRVWKQEVWWLRVHKLRMQLLSKNILKVGKCQCFPVGWINIAAALMCLLHFEMIYLVTLHIFFFSFVTTYFPANPKISLNFRETLQILSETTKKQQKSLKLSLQGGFLRWGLGSQSNIACQL